VLWAISAAAKSKFGVGHAQFSQCRLLPFRAV